MLNLSSIPLAVLGVPFHNVTMDEAIGVIEEQIREGCFHQVATGNVDFLKNAMGDDRLREILCSCNLVVPDGMPIVWLSRLIGSPLKERVGGIDLVERLADVSARRGYGIFLLGSSEVRSQRAAKVLKQRHPDLRIVGRYCPERRPLEEMDHEDILSRIEEANPEILLVAFGNPKQEEWIAMHRDRLRVPVCIGVGGTLDVLSGTMPRAPQWMQRSGLEWLHRTALQPKRLAKRYVSDALCLLRHVPGYIAASATQPRKASRSSIAVHQVGNTKLISVVGNMTGTVLEEFNAYTRDASAEGMNIVVDMAQTGYLGPDSLGSLICLGSRMRRRGEQLWLAEAPRHLVRILKTGQLQNYFMTTKMVRDALYRTAKAEQKLLAGFMPSQGTIFAESSSVDVRIEVFQDVCLQMVDTEQPEEPTLATGEFATAGG